MKALGALWIYAGVLRPASRNHAAQTRRGFRVTRGEEGHFVASGHEPFGQERSKEFPRPIVARGDSPRNGCEYRDAHEPFSAPVPGDQPSCLALLASPFLPLSSPLVTCQASFPKASGGSCRAWLSPICGRGGS